MDEKDRRRVLIRSWHEAGHAVARLALLKQAVGIVICPGENYCDNLALPVVPPEAESAMFQDWLVVVRAGEAAQLLFTSDEIASQLAARDDHERAAEFIKKLIARRGDNPSEHVDEAIALFNQAFVRAKEIAAECSVAIDTLAQALLAEVEAKGQCQMTAEEVHSIVSPLLPEKYWDASG